MYSWYVSDASVVLWSDRDVDMQATFECLLKTYGFLTPDLWRETRFSKSPFQEFTDFLAKPHKISVLEDVEKTPVY